MCQQKLATVRQQFHFSPKADTLCMVRNGHAFIVFDVCSGLSAQKYYVVSLSSRPYKYAWKAGSLSQACAVKPQLWELRGPSRHNKVE